MLHKNKAWLKGYGFGQGGPALISGDVQESQECMPNSVKYIDTTAIMARPGEHGCPRCSGQVFHAEQMFSKGSIYHKVRKYLIATQIQQCSMYFRSVRTEPSKSVSTKKIPSPHIFTIVLLLCTGILHS